MTHSKMVQTRRKNAAASKRRASFDKLAKKLGKRRVPGEHSDVTPSPVAA